jgi:ABC-type transport system involved in cytochrome bd biosynthesis fused ATPase/permease subunit
LKSRKRRYLFDGKDLLKLDLKSLRSHIGSVTQNGKLFSGDIRSNILLAALSHLQKMPGRRQKLQESQKIPQYADGHVHIYFGRQWRHFRRSKTTADVLPEPLRIDQKF